MSRKIEVVIAGDARSLERAFGKAGKSGSSFGSTMAKVGKASLIAGGAIAAGVVVGLKKSVDAAKEAEVSQQKMQTQLKALGISFDAHSAQIETAIQKTSKLAALDDEDLQDAFTALVRVTGDVNKGLEGTALAADIARGKGIELEAATAIVTKASLGMVGSLKRQGIEITAVTAAMDALKAAHGKATAAQIESAKAADLAATKQKAIAALQKTFAGAAEDYGKTSAAASERFQVALENLKEHIGAKLLPALTKLTGWAADHLPTLEKWADQLGTAIQPKLDALGKWASTHKEDFQRLFADAKSAAEKLGGAFSKLLGWTDRFAKAIGGWDKLIETAITAAAIGKIVALGGAMQKAAAAAGAMNVSMLSLVRMRKIAIVVGISLVLVEGQAIWDFLKTNVDKIGVKLGAAPGETASHLSLPDVRKKVGGLIGIGGGKKGLPSAPGSSGDRMTQGITRELQGAIRGPLQQTFREVFGFAMTAGIKDAIRSAKSNLSSLTGGLSGMVGQGIDAGRAKSLAALGNSEDAKRLRQIRANQQAEGDAREEARLRAEGDAQGLADFLLDKEASTIEARLALQEAAINDEAEKRKAAFDRGIADLTAAFNTGQITAVTFNTQLQGLLAATGVEWNGVGDLLGSEFAAGFGAQLAAIKAQIAALGVPGAAGIGGGTGVEKPMAAVKAEQARIAAAAKAEQARIAALPENRALRLRSQAMNKIFGLASGGIVTRPTLAMVGESGPEAVIPLSRMGGGSPRGGDTFVFEIGGRELVRFTYAELLRQKGRNVSLEMA